MLRKKKEAKYALNPFLLPTHSLKMGGEGRGAKNGVVGGGVTPPAPVLDRTVADGPLRNGRWKMGHSLPPFPFSLRRFAIILLRGALFAPVSHKSFSWLFLYVYRPPRRVEGSERRALSRTPPPLTGVWSQAGKARCISRPPRFSRIPEIAQRREER